jgi:hypothetical protein
VMQGSQLIGGTCNPEIRSCIIPIQLHAEYCENFFASEAIGEIMRRITLVGAGLVLVAGVMAANAQGIGYAPGVNPSNPQDLTHRSNPQDLLAPGGSNPQDLVRRPPAVSGPLPRNQLNSVPSSPSSTSGLQYTVKAKPKQKPRHRRSAAQR